MTTKTISIALQVKEDVVPDHLTKPLVHLNGTSRNALRDQYEEAYRAVNGALRSLEEVASPNARDYYPLGPDAFNKAVGEHRARIDKLRVVRDELLSLYEHVEEAGT